MYGVVEMWTRDCSGECGGREKKQGDSAVCLGRLSYERLPISQWVWPFPGSSDC